MYGSKYETSLLFSDGTGLIVPGLTNAQLYKGKLYLTGVVSPYLVECTNKAFSEYEAASVAEGSQGDRLVFQPAYVKNTVPVNDAPVKEVEEELVMDKGTDRVAENAHVDGKEGLTEDLKAKSEL